MSTQITPPKAGSAAPAAMLVLTATLLLGPSAGAATTNWVAYNDHARGGGTAANVSVYSIGTSTAVGGPLTNYDTGTLITPNRVGVDIRPVVTPINGVTGDCTAPSSGTPADQLFGGKVAWGSSAIYFGDTPYTENVTITFTNLTPGKRYVFRGVAQRGNSSYTARWTLATLAGAVSARAAHLTGPGSPGIVTNGWAPYGEALAPITQALVNSGANLCGDVIGWDAIEPQGASFSVICSNYQGALPGGLTSEPTYTYAINAFFLAEVEPDECTNHIVLSANTPADTAAIEAASLTLSAEATGCATNYQWYRNGEPIPGATDAVYFDPVVTPETDAGQYWVVVKGPVDPDGVSSRHATVTVLPDTNPPCLLGAVARPDPLNAGWDQVVVTFSEPVDTEDAELLENYALHPAGSPEVWLPIIDAALVTPTNVLLTTIRRAPQTDYSLQVGMVRDRSSNRNPIPPACASLAIEAETALLQLAAAPPETAAVWRYFTVAGANLGTAWREPGYVDANWPSGPAPLDANNDTAPGRTVLLNNMLVGTRLPRVTSPDYFTRYFRTTVFLPAAPNDVRLEARWLVDDGAVVYVNGQEAFRLRMPAGAVSYSTPASQAVSDPGPNVEGPYLLATTNLVPGNNVIAVELHQNATSSSDATLSVELMAYIRKFAAGPVVIEGQPQGGSVAEGGAFAFRVSATGALPIGYQWRLDNAPLPGATNATYVVSGANLTHQGDYSVVVSNPHGAVPSQAAPLTVVADTEAPRLLAVSGGRPTNLALTAVFSKLLDPTSAGDPAHYRMIGPGALQITNVTVAGSNVALRLSGPRQPNVTYLLEARDVLDLAFTPNPIAPNPSRVPVSTLAPLISAYNHTWRFLQQTGPGQPAPCPEGVVWTLPGFDDSSWGSGTGLFFGQRSNNITPIQLPFVMDPANAGISVANTLLNLFTNTSPANSLQERTHYFRTTFELSGPTNGVSFEIHALVDDGAIIYLNGQRVHQVRMTNAAPSCASYADQTVGLASWDPPYSAAGRAIPASALRAGVNTLAVEVHQSDLTSPDVAFGLVLEGNIPVFGGPALTAGYEASNGALTLSWEAGPEWRLYASGNLEGPWTKVADVSPHQTSAATGTQFFRLQQDL